MHANMNKTSVISIENAVNSNRNCPHSAVLSLSTVRLRWISADLHRPQKIVQLCFVLSL